MASRGLLSVREVRQRQPLAAASFNLVAGLGVAVLAAGLVLLGLLATDVPSPSFSVVFFSWSPTGAAAALPILAARAHRDHDPMLGWFAGGLAVSLVAMVLQVLSLPTVSPGGGALGTSSNGNAALYLLFHLALYGAALAAAARLPSWAAWPVSLAGVVLAALVATNLVPLPQLLTPAREGYTDLLVGAELGLAVVGLAALLAWSRATGSPTTPLRAWIGVALLVSVLELVLNAVAAERYDAMWWSSLSMRLTTFGLLAIGCIVTVVRELGRVERYSEVELGFRDREIQGMVAVTDLLLANAQRLGRCRRVADVVREAEATLVSLAGVDQASLAGVVDGSVQVVSAPTGPVDWADVHRRIADEPAAWWAETGEEAAARGLVGGGAAAGLPLHVSGEPVGSLVVVAAGDRPWGPADRELMTGVAEQVGQALVRAQMAERDRDAALTLQAALTPAVPTDLGGLGIAFRYVPATVGTQVGGDWADCWQLPDGRVALVVGDVVGKGLGAAATMGRLRAGIRALAAVDPTPAVVLRRLDEIEAEAGPGMVATVLYAVVDTTTCCLTLARAGHLPLALAEASGEVALVEEGGSPPIGLGVPARSQSVLPLPAGSVIALFTDGLVERRDQPLARGLTALRDALATPHGGAEATADALMALAPEHIGDDIALLVVTVPGETSGQSEATMSHQTHLPEPVE